MSPENSFVADGQALKYKNILIVRTDRIGDVVLTLPLVRVLRREYPLARISFLIRTYTKDVVEGQAGVDGIVLYDDGEAPKHFRTLLSELRRSKFDLALVAFPRFRVALLLWLSGVRTRVGSGYRWYSFLFNKRVYEHRKTAEKHEFEYNHSLIRSLGCRASSDDRPRITLSPESIRAADFERKRLHISDKEIVAILHPGSGGSARDWSGANFGLLARELSTLGWTIVVSGARGEETLVHQVVEGSGGIARPSVAILSLKELAAFIKAADLFVSNSTGPLHIAAAVETPVIGFYPPITACSPRRWGPVTDQKAVFVPERNRCELCHGAPCRGSVCMEQIKVQDVVNAAKRLVKKRKSKRPSKFSVAL